MEELLSKLQATRLPFAELLQIVFTAATPDRVTATMLVRPELCTIPAILHGGAVMALADSVGAAATFINLPPNTHTTTIESKTNFFAPAPIGTTVTAESTPLHKGKKTQVWQTRVTGENGRLLAQITQTQMVLELKS